MLEGAAASDALFAAKSVQKALASVEPSNWRWGRLRIASAKAARCADPA